jgi:hypothetical protein
VRRVGVVLGSCLLAVCLAPDVVPAAVAGARPDDGRGDADVTAAAYDWLGADTPNDTYAITLVRGRSVRSVLRVLAPRRDLGPRTAAEAYEFYFDRLDPRTYPGPHVTQVDARGPGVVVVDVSGFPDERQLARLSRRGTVSSFFTTVELDTYVTVARRGRVIRRFDTNFRPPREGALPEERGLGFGEKGVDPFSPAWALNERLTLIHVSEDWFFGAHATYVLPGRG